MPVPEIYMMADVMFGEITFAPVRFRRAVIEIIDEEEIRLPRGKGKGFVESMFGQVDASVKDIIRAEVVLLLDRYFELGTRITAKVGIVAFAYFKPFVAHEIPDVIQAIHASILQFRLCRGQGAPSLTWHHRDDSYQCGEVPNDGEHA